MAGPVSGGRDLFRKEALERYSRGRRQTHEPSFAVAGVALCRWLAIASTVVVAGALWFVRVPTNTSSVAVVGRVPAELRCCAGQLAVMVVSRPTVLPDLRAGQRVSVDLGGGGTPLARPLTEVLPKPATADEAADLLGLPPDIARQISGPVAIAVARLEPSVGGRPSSSYEGTVARARITLRSPRLAWLLVRGLSGRER